MSQAAKPLLEVNLGDNGGQHMFSGIAEVEEWLAKEERFWSWLSNARANTAWVNLQNNFRTIRETVQSIQGSKKTPDFSQIKHKLEAPYLSGQCLHSSTPRARFIEEIRNQNQVVAGFALEHFLNVQFGSFPPDRLRGAFVADAFDRGLSAETSQANRQALEALLGSAQAQVADQKAQLVQLQQQSDAWVANADDVLKKQDAQFQDQLRQWQQDADKVRKAYDEFMALKAPVTYWNDKACKHWWGKLVYGLFALVSGFLGGAAIFGIVWKLLPERLDPTDNPPLLRFTGMVLVVFTAAFWLTRVFVRMYLSHAHLEADANERATMAQTYLALIREGQADPEKDRGLVFPSLFRPTSTGIVRDDALPPTWADLVAKLGGGRS